MESVSEAVALIELICGTLLSTMPDRELVLALSQISLNHDPDFNTAYVFQSVTM